MHRGRIVWAARQAEGSAVTAIVKASDVILAVDS
jgi:molybdopterin-binding protein